MDRKRNIIIISSLIILFFLVALINLFYVNKSQEVYENEKSNNYISENILTMMYETAEGSGEYVVASDTTWPQDGYTFNEQLSSCENGGTLTWDDENKRVIMQTNTSDKCYVYFDVEVPCTNYMNVGDSITTIEENCGPFASGCTPTYNTENFVYSYYVLFHENSGLYENFPYVLESYYTETPSVPNVEFKNTAMGQEYGLFNEDYVTRTEPGSGAYAYSYKLSSDKNYCDICINGYTETVVDCNTENWWVNNGE